MPKALRNTTHPLKGMTSKKVPAVDTHPYLTQLAWGNPSYHTGLEAAQKHLIKGLEADEYSFGRLNATDAVEAIKALKASVADVGVDGGKVAGVLDPYSGIKFRAEIVLRRPV